jgi:hypothetical protein
MEQGDRIAAGEAAFHITARLGRLLVWTMFWVAHLMVATLFLGLAWWFQMTPGECVETFRHLQATMPAVVFVGLGGSIAGLAVAYWRALRWMHRAAGQKWLAGYVMRDLQ